MVAGRKRKPTALRVMDGTMRSDRYGDPDAEPGVVVNGVPSCPSDMGEAGRKIWDAVLPLIVRHGYLADLDVSAFERFARLHDELANCEQAIDEDGAYHILDSGSIQQHPAINRKMKVLDMIRRYEIEFWLTPTARAGKQVAKSDKPKVATRQRQA